MRNANCTFAQFAQVAKLANYFAKRPPLSKSTKKSLANATRKHKSALEENGEVLTNDDSQERLSFEKEQRSKARKKAASTGIWSKTSSGQRLLNLINFDIFYSYTLRETVNIAKR